MRTATTANDGGRAKHLKELATQGGTALAKGRLESAVAAAQQTHVFMRENLTEAQVQDFGQRALQMLSQTPFGAVLGDLTRSRDLATLDALRPLTAAFCMPLPPQEARGKPPRTGDPDTDTPGGSVHLRSQIPDDEDASTYSKTTLEKGERKDPPRPDATTPTLKVRPTQAGSPTTPPAKPNPTSTSKMAGPPPSPAKTPPGRAVPQDRKPGSRED